MTMAERTREITNKANEQIRLTRLAKHNIYVKDKLINGKIYRKANRGYSKMQVKLPKKYCVSIVLDELRNRGYQVREARANGRSILTIEW